MKIRSKCRVRVARRTLMVRYVREEDFQGMALCFSVVRQLRNACIAQTRTSRTLQIVRVGSSQP